MPIIEYELHKLGWHSFQQLCIAICREIFGQTVERYLNSADGGRDGAFTGIWKDGEAVRLCGRFVIQCKFTSKRGHRLSKSDLADEFKKVKRLVKEGRCDNYIILTNAGVSGLVAENIETYFKNAGAKQVRIYGSCWINEQITENKRLRMLMPRVYGLGDLTEILDERAVGQGQALINSMREDLAKVVLTDAYYKAINAVEEYGFVLLIGEPAAGKTTIASMIAMVAIDQWEAKTIKVDSPSKLKDHWNADDPARVFWIDDAFGVTQYESTLSQGWNHIIPEVKAMLSQGIKIIMTSRDYIYKRARKDLKSGAFPLFQEGRVVIDVHDLSLDEKRQILYNHLKLGKQPKDYITGIKPFLSLIAEQERFIPETARRLSDPIFTGSLAFYEHTISDFVNSQERFLMDTLESLDADSKAAIALVFMNNDHLESPIELGESEKDAIEKVGSTVGACFSALDAMNGSLVQLTYSDNQSVWRFKHPTIGDAFAKVIVENPELLGVYIRGSSLTKLLSQVTMGDVGLEKAIIVPNAYFTLVLDRLLSFTISDAYKDDWNAKWFAKHTLRNFLARRCNKQFLTSFIEKQPELIKEVSSPGLYLSYSPEVDLVVRLFDYKLLPEENRKKFVEKISKYAIDGEDVYVLESEKLAKVFTADELKQVKRKIKDELIPNLRAVQSSWEADYNADSNEPPDEYINRFAEILRTLKEEYSEEENLVKTIEEHISDIEYWIDEHKDAVSLFQPERVGAEHGPSSKMPDGRDIFDDIDD